MSVNLNSNSIPNNWAGIDVQNINKVSEKIFQRAQQKTVDLNQIDLSKFNRQTQGIDLYKQNVSLDTQRYVAMQNAGLFAQVNNTAMAQLNAQAAMNLYGTDVAHKVQGRITISTSEVERERTTDVYPVVSPTEVYKTSSMAKDKRGSNALAYQRSSFGNEDKDGLDIQA